MKFNSYPNNSAISINSEPLKENLNNSEESIFATVTSEIFALVAQIERELISLKTKEALHLRKLAGIKLGCPKGKGKSELDIYKDDILKILELKVPKIMIAKRYRCSVANLYNF